MRTFWSQPLRRQLILANLVLGLGPVLGLAIWSSMGTIREHRADLQKQAQSVATNIADGLSRDLDYLDSVAQTLVDDSVVQTLDPAQLRAKLDQARTGRPVFIGIAVSAQGTVLAATTTDNFKLPLTPVEVCPSAKRVRQAERVNGDRPLYAILERAVDRGVLLAPGDAFGSVYAQSFARLCYTGVPSARVVAGIERLRDAVDAYIAGRP